MFNNMPLDENLNSCPRSFLQSDLIRLAVPRSVCNDILCMATKNVQFSFNDLIFRQVDDVEIGSPLDITLGNIFVSYYQNRLLQKLY